jgi:acetoin utilization protein AcuB
MLVKDRMTMNPVVGYPDMPVTEAQALMKEHNVNHLPVLGKDGKLVGLLTPRLLSRALPSDISSFSQFEITYLLAKVKVGHIMVKDVITINEGTAIEEAARVMSDRKIACLPVMRDGELVGIITDQDLFTIMVDLLGARRPGLRVTVVQPDRPGAIARLTTAIADAGGYLSVSVGYFAAQPGQWVSVLKVRNLSREQLVAAVESLGEVRIEDLRETMPGE